MYKILYLDSVENDLKRLDKTTIRKIFTRIESVLAEDPQGLGKALKGKFKGMWRYRFGDFRIIYKISESEILIIVARIGHRKDIYE